jgi:hypothetical protein
VQASKGLMWKPTRPQNGELRLCRRGGGISRRFQGGDFGQSRLDRARSLFGAEVDTFCANERDVAHTKEAD